MKYYEKISNSAIKCNLCAHNCVLKNQQIGICGVSKNVNGELNNLVYNSPVALQIDPIEKKPLFRFLPGSYSFSIGTYGCNMKCAWCQNYSLSQHSIIGEEKRKSQYSIETLVEMAISNNCKSITYTYNEPTVFYPYAKDIGIHGKKHNLKNIFVTNGYQTPEIIEDMSTWVDAANIDIKSFNPKTYKSYIKASLKIVLRNIELYHKKGIYIELTTLIIPTINDSLDELKQIAEFIYKKCGAETPWHVSAFHPDYKLQNIPKTEREIVYKARDIGLKTGLKYVYTGNI